MVQLELCVQPSSWLSPAPTSSWSQPAPSSFPAAAPWCPADGAQGKMLGGGCLPWLFWQGSSSSKDKAASCSPGWGGARGRGSQGWARGAGAAGATAGRDGGEGEAETESCVALSVADVYCTGWAGWKGGRLEQGPGPPPAQLGRVGLARGPSLAVAVYIQCRRLQSVGQRHACTPPPAHTCP